MSRMVWKFFLGLALIYGLAPLPAQANLLLKFVPSGSWGGEHIRLNVSEVGSTIESDCTVGTINGALILDSDGNFEAPGIYVFERGGPHRIGEPPPRRHPAQYRGWTDGNQMRLSVMLLETGEVVGNFSLGLGRPPQLEKCL